MEVLDIPLDKIKQFSARDLAYYTNPTQFSQFVAHDFEFDEFPKIIKAKQQQNIDRNLLHQVITDQYAETSSSEITKKNISALLKNNTYTVVTAHQPSLLTGPLYYIYKILSAVKLAERLQKEYSGYHFVPCFVLGSEDHDFEEINHMHLYGRTYQWEEKSGGSVGAYKPEKLEELLSEVVQVLGEKSKAQEILSKLKSELNAFVSYDQFAFRLTHILFDHLGLVILRMSDARLKRAFIPIIKEEIFSNPSKAQVTKTQTEIKENLGYNEQAFVRDINFFYCQAQRRDRIELIAERYTVVDTELSFSKEEMAKEIEAHPERFSPNVVMRPIYQEYILPNLAYIGGGGELAYWTERKTQFEHFGVPYPMLIRRRSGLILTPSSKKQMDKLGISIQDSFEAEQTLITKLISDSTHPNYELQDLKSQVDTLFDEITNRVVTIDKTLVKTAGSEKAKTLKSLDFIESKLKKAIKQKEEINLNRLSKLKSNLFPKGLQERHDNIFQYISTYGAELIDDLLEHCDPFDKTFKVFVMPQAG